MRFLFVAALRRPFLALAVVVIAVVTLAVVQPWKAPEAHSQARLAEHDPVWTANPAAGFIQSRYVVLADASWVPGGGRTTVVGRWYRTAPDLIAMDRGGWTLAATKAGWTTSADAACPGRFSKRLGKWVAVLTIAPDATGRLLGVRISFPAGEDAAGTACPR